MRSLFTRKTSGEVQGMVEIVSDQKIIWPEGGSEHTRESFRHVTVNGRLYIFFPDEHDKDLKEHDSVTFKIRSLNHDDYGSRHVIEKNSVRVVHTHTPVIALDKYRAA